MTTNQPNTDPLPHNGITTTCDALWEPVADSAGPFMRTAASLASDRVPLAALRRGLRDRIRRSQFVDARYFAAKMESAYRVMWSQRRVHGSSGVA